MRSHGYRLIVLALLVSFVATMAVGCGGGSTSSGTSTNQPTSNIKAAMVTDIGGLGDKSFNDLAAAGLSKAKTDLGVDYKVLESKEAADYEPNLTQLATAGYNPIFAVGFLMQDTLSKISTAYPDVTFGGIDISYDPPIANVVGLNFKEQEAAYLAGYLAATLTTMPNVDSRINAQPLIGFVGGMPVPAVNRFQAGYIAGAKAANPAVQVKSIMTGSFTDQQKGLEAGKTLIEAGCDIIFAAAGQTGLGTAKACKDGNALFIGVDADQYNTIPGIGDTIITSAVKRVDSAVFDVVKRANDGTLKGGENLLYGLKEQGVGLAPYHEWDSKVPADVKDKIETAKAAVIDGSVTVPETVQQ